MILAIKNKIACYYNSEEERNEILDLFSDKSGITYNIFENNDKNKALYYANVSKITGFLLERKDPFKELSMLKDKGIELVSFKVKGESYCVILNDIYYPRSEYRLKYDKIHDSFFCSKFNGNLRDTSNDLCNNILDYQKQKGSMFLRTAVLNYNMAYRKEYGENFWKCVTADKFFNFELDKDHESILFKCIGKRLENPIISLSEYYCQLEDKQKDVEIKKDDITNIREVPVFLSIKNEEIKSLIKDNLYI